MPLQFPRIVTGYAGNCRSALHKMLTMEATCMFLHPAWSLGDNG